MVMFRRRRMMRRSRGPPLVTYKHQRNEDLTYIGLEANQNFVIYTGGNQGSQTSSQNVPSGARVESVFVSVNFVAPEGNTTGTYSWMLVKLRDGQSVADIAVTGASAFTAVGLSNMRNQIFHTEMGIHATEDAGVIRYNRQIKIPKIYQRVREGDIIMLVFNATSAGPLSIGTRFKSKQ